MTEVSPYVLWSWRIFFPILSLVLTYGAIISIRRVKNIHHAIFLIMALLYPVGKSAAMWVVGPRWMRWYLGDLGFVAFIAFWQMVSARKHATPLTSARRGAWLGFVLAMAPELFFLVAKPFVKMKVKYMATGDWWDVVMYCVSLPIVLYLIGYLKHRFEPTPKATPFRPTQDKRRNRPRRQRK